MVERPTGTTVLAVLHFALGVYWIVAAVGSVVGASLYRVASVNREITLMIGLALVLSLAFGGGFLAVGYGLWRLRNWARKITIGIAAICLSTGSLAIIAWASGSPPDDDGNGFQRLVYVLQLLLFMPYWLVLLTIEKAAGLLFPWLRSYEDTVLLYVFWGAPFTANAWIVWYMMRSSVRQAFGSRP